MASRSLSRSSSVSDRASFQPQDTSTPVAGPSHSAPPTNPAPVEVPPEPPVRRLDLMVPGAEIIERKLVVPFLQRRSVVCQDAELEALRLSYVQEGLRILRNEEYEPGLMLTPRNEQDAHEEMSLLDSFLKGIPVSAPGTEDGTELNYVPDNAHFGPLLSLLVPHLNVINKYMRWKRQDEMQLPVWGWENNVTTPMEEMGYAQIASVYREDVETFLAYAYQPHAAPSKGTPFRRRRRTEVGGSRLSNDPFLDIPDRYQSPEVVSERRYTIPAMRSPRAPTSPLSGTNATPLGNRVRYAPDTRDREAEIGSAANPYEPEVPNLPAKAESEQSARATDSPEGSRLNTNELRERLAQARRTSIPTQQEAATQHRNRINGSRRLTELFQEPQFVHSPRPDSFATGPAPRSRPPHLSTVQEDPVPPDVPQTPPTAHRGNPYSYYAGPTGPTPNANRGIFSQLPLMPPGRDSTESQTLARLGIPHFDQKLKVDLIEEWDGNIDTLIDWFESVNALAARSPLVYMQLGELAPTRFTKKAKNWWLSLTVPMRRAASQDWGSLRRAVAGYYMSRKWFDRIKLEAKECKYRDHNAPSETPGEYFIRKFKLLDTAEEYSDSLMIMTIMDGAPRFWHSIIDTMTVRTPAELQDKIQYHEDALKHAPGDQSSSLRSLENRLKALEVVKRPSFNPLRRFPFKGNAQANLAETVEEPTDDEPVYEAHANLVGWSQELPKPSFPRDDATRSKGKSPEDKGARPCRHCGSPKHWDNECKYSKKGTKLARANFATASDDYWQALDDYEAVYCESSSDDEVVPLN